MEVKVKVKCSECNGEGVLANPFYDMLERVKRKHLDDTGDFMKAAQEDAFLKENGYSDWPWEERDCDDCSGTGSRFVDREMFSVQVFHLSQACLESFTVIVCAGDIDSARKIAFEEYKDLDMVKVVPRKVLC